MIPLDISKINQQEEVGKGQNSTIYPFEDDKSVVKKIHLKSFSEFSAALQSVILGFNLDHDSIVPVQNYSIQQNEESDYILFIQMSKLKQNFADLIKEGKSITKEEIMLYISSLISGLEYLHNKKGSAHGNIKPTNILITDENNKAVFSDIGFRGSNPYKAPELNSIESMTQLGLIKGDIWSLGVVISELILQKTNGLFEAGVESIEQKEEVIREILKDINEKFGEDIMDIIKGMLSIDSEKRTLAKDIKQKLRDLLGNPLSEKKEENSVRKDSAALKKSEKLEDIRNEVVSRVESLLKLIPEEKLENPEEIKRVFNDEIRERFESLGRVSRIAIENHNQFGLDISKKLEESIMGLSGISNISNHLHEIKEQEETKLDLLPPTIPELTAEEQILQNWDEFRDSFEREWGSSFQLQLEEALSVRVNAFSLDEKNFYNFLTDLGSNLAKYQFELKLLELALPAESLTSSGIKAIGMILNGSKDFHSLQYLNLNLAKSPFVTKIEFDGPAVRDMMFNVCKSLRSLKSLSLCFSELLAECFQSSQIFRNKKIDEATIDDLGKHIGYNLLELKRLKIDLSWCEALTERAFRGFSSHLKSLKGLQTLILDFRKSHFTNTFFEDFVNNICRNLVKLQQIKLYISLNERITDAGVKTLAVGMSHNLKELQEVTLHFKQCPNISENAKDILRQKLSYVLNLNVL